MAEDQLRSIIETIRGRLQAELETHLGSLAESHASAIAEARKTVEAAAEQRWTAKLDEARGEWDARLTAETAAARADVERALSAEVLRVRSEAEQRAADAASQARRDLDEAVAAERRRAQADLERAQAERERAHADLERAHADLERAQADRERAHTEHERLTVDLQRAFGDLDRTQADLQRLQGEFGATQSDLQRVQSELASTQSDLQRVQSELASTQADLQRGQGELAATQADRERLQTDCDRTHGELERARTEHQRAHAELQRVQAELAASHSDLQRLHVELATAQADVACAKEDVVRTRQELQRAHDDLQRVQTELETAHAEAAGMRRRVEREIAEAQRSVTAERAGAAHGTPAGMGGPIRPDSSSSSALLDAIRKIDQAPSLSEALAAAVRGASLESPRVALFIVNGGVLQEWPVDGVPSLQAGQFSVDGDEAGFLADVIASGEAKSIDGSQGAPAPAFADLPGSRRAIAVPFVLGGQPVAVLYADEGADGEPLASWRESLQILGRHASACLAHLTVVRTAQAMNLVAAGSGSNGPMVDDEEHGARRYARLLVSEIKMYNDSAVRAGRERRDLLERLKPEIDRARRLYEQRIAPSHARDHYFRQELVQTLADGDHSLLG